MPLTISSEATADKNKLRSDVIWIDLIEFLYPDEDPVRICSDNQAVTWKGHEWQPMIFIPPEIEESKNAQIPDAKLVFHDITQEITSIIDQYDGAIGAEVNLYTVLSSMLDSAIPEREESMELLSAQIDHQSVVTLSLGAENLQNRKCTPSRYLKNHCRFIFKGNKCGYMGSETDCDLSFSRCRELGNQSRYGGFPAVGSLGYRI